MQVLHKASKKTTASSQIWGFQANILAKAHHLGVAGCSPETKIWPTAPRLLLQPGNSGSVQIFSALDIPFPFHLFSSWAERVPWGSAASERPEVQLLVKPQGLMAAARGRSGGGTAGPRAAPTLWETKLQPAFLRLWLLARRSQTAWPEGTKALDKWTATPRMHRAKPLPFPCSGTSGISASAYFSPWAEPGGGGCVWRRLSQPGPQARISVVTAEAHSLRRCSQGRQKLASEVWGSGRRSASGDWCALDCLSALNRTGPGKKRQCKNFTDVRGRCGPLDTVSNKL